MLDDRLDDLVVADHSAPAQPPLQVVGPAAQHARERAAQEGEQLRALAAEPREAQRAQQGDAKAGAVERHARVERHRHPDGGERRLERGPVPGHRRHDHADLVGLKARAHEPGDLGRHLLGDAAAAAGLEQHHAAVGIRRGRRRPVREQRLPEVGEDGRVVMVGRRQLLDGRRLRQGLDQRPHGGVGGPADLVRQRHGHLAAGGQRPQGAHLGAGHVLEAVGEHGAGVPGVEPALEQTGRELPPARAVVRPAAATAAR